jgi:hypothetical protein
VQKILKYLKLTALGLLAAASAHAGTFQTDFSTDPSTNLNFGGSLWDGVTTTGTGSANWQTNGGAGKFGSTSSGPVLGVTNDGFLQLTFADHNCESNLSTSLCGGVLFDDFDNGLVVAAFTFDADLRIGNGNPSPADGFSINYVRDNDPVLNALNQGDTFPEMNGKVSPAGGQFEDNGVATDISLMEEGTQTGLSICFDMWDSSTITIPANPPAVGQEVPGITHDYIGLDIRVDGLLLTTIQMPNGTTGNSGPGTTSLTASDTAAIETGPYDGSGCDANLSWVHLKVDLDVNGVLNVYWKNKQILTNLQTAYFPSPGRLLMASRVGGNTANIEIDNIQITTVPSPLALAGGAVGFPDGFSIQVNDSGPSQFDTNKPVALTLNGTNVTATTVAKNGNLTLITYHGYPTLLPPGSSNIVTISSLDTRGTNITGTSSFIVPAYSIVSPNYAVTGVDTTKIGFKVAPFQTATPNSGPSSSFAQFQQAGLEGSNIANLTQTIDGFTADASGAYTVTDPVNWANIDSFAFTGNAGSFNSGNGYTDLEFPGMPPVGGDQGNDEYYALSERVLTYLYLPTAGVYQMGVDSASGFTVTTGRNPADALALLVGAHEGGGQNNTTFYFVANKAGYYPFGLLYYNGADAANAEWFTVVNGTRYLIDDLTSTNVTGVVGYYAGPALPAYVSTVLDSPLQFIIKLTDEATTVTDSSILLSLNGSAVAPTVGKDTNGVTTVNYTLPSALAAGSSNSLTLVYTDSAGVTTTNHQTYIAPNYTAVPASIVVTGVNTNDIGFKVKPVQNVGGGSTTIAWAESQIAGLDGTNYIDVNQNIDGFTIDTNGYYTVTDPINWDRVSQSGTDGNFNNNNGYPEFEFPGMPGNNGVSGNDLYENLSEEVLTYMYFPAAGVYEMGVNSDDGFKVTTGVNPKDQLSSIDVGQQDGGRGSADTDFNILIQAPGYYPFRLLYYNGGGGANCEWFTFQNGVRYLINDPDPSNTTGIHAYYAGPSLPPYVASVKDSPTNVVFDLAQSGSATIDSNSVQVSVNGYTGVLSLGTTSGGLTSATFTVTNAIGFASGSTNEVTLIFTASTGQKVTNTVSLVTPSWQSIPASFAVTGVDTNKPGFKVKPFLSANGTTIASAEQELAGDNGTNKANLTQIIDGSPIDSNGYYTWTDVINWDEVAAGTTGNHDGHFQPTNYPDLEFPGMPLVGEATNGLANSAWNNLEEEILTFVDFPSAGFYTMGINSDDGFNMTVGPDPAKYGTNGPALVLGDFDGGRGSSDTDFSFYVGAAGTYRFRVLYFNGGGGANCEWTSIDPATGTRYLLNDGSTINPTGVHAYYAGPGVVVVTSSQFNPPVLAGGSLTITWTGTATLQQAPSLNGPWTDTTPAPTGNSYTATIGSGNLFYRLKE